MKYMISVNNKEYGPVSEDILIKWIEEGRIVEDTLIRNEMFSVWKKASELDFLKESFIRQNLNFSKSGLNPEISDISRLTDDNARTKILKERIPQHIFYQNRFLPDPAPFSLRFKAGIIDLLIVGALISLLYIGSCAIFSIANISFESVFYLFFFLSSLFFLVYYAGCLGVFAQTVGMWFWGILLVRNSDDAESVYLLRAFIYALCLLLFGLFSSLLFYLIGNKRALHDIVTGTQVVKISARSKFD